MSGIGTSDAATADEAAVASAAATNAAGVGNVATLGPGSSPRHDAGVGLSIMHDQPATAPAVASSVVGNGIAGSRVGAGLPVAVASAGADVSGLDRRVWSYQETEILIRLRADEGMKKKFCAMKRNRNLWDDIAAKMNSHGCLRSGTQCAVRWKNLMSLYKESRVAMLNGNDPSVGGRSQRACGFYAELEACVGDTPVFGIRVDQQPSAPSASAGLTSIPALAAVGKSVSPEAVGVAAASSAFAIANGLSDTLAANATQTTGSGATTLTAAGVVPDTASARVLRALGQAEATSALAAHESALVAGLNTDGGMRPAEVERLEGHRAAVATGDLIEDRPPGIRGPAARGISAEDLAGVVDKLVKGNAQLRDGLMLVRADVEKQGTMLSKMNSILLQIAGQLGALGSEQDEEASPTSKRQRLV
jgi:hypothetical protein